MNKEHKGHTESTTDIRISNCKWERFRNWLLAEGYNERTTNSRISNCERVENYEGDLDGHFNRDNLNSLIENRLEYSTQDQQLQKQPKHNIPINGDIRNGTATLKQAIKLYREFKLSEISGGRLFSINTGKQPVNNEKKKSKNQIKKWPEWKQPDEDTILKLSKAVTPFVRFLNPQIIHEITEDNHKHRDEWSEKLRGCGVDPNIYLWDGSPCAFPVRRGTNKERKDLNKKHPDCLCLDPDGNSFPKHLWAFILTSCEFRNHGPQGYQLAHLFDHKTYEKGLYKDRWQKEIEGWDDPKNPPKLFGLFTSPANTVYVPTDFLKPTDHNHRLRTLLQRQAFKLYADVCQILPPPLKVKDCNEQEWDIKEFQFCDPVGEDMRNVSQFLKFRDNKINELFEKISF